MTQWIRTPSLRVLHIYRKIQRCGCQQVRFYKGRILSFKFPAPRGYGVKGILIGVYTHQTPKEYIEEDVTSLIYELIDKQCLKCGIYTFNIEPLEPN